MLWSWSSQEINRGKRMRDKTGKLITLISRKQRKVFFCVNNSPENAAGNGIAPSYSAGLRAGWSEVRVLAGSGTTASRQAVGPTQPPIQWVPRALSLGVKQPGHEADHSPPSNAEVKNEWSYGFHKRQVISWLAEWVLLLKDFAPCS
jgi:hypothetical protein